MIRSGICLYTDSYRLILYRCFSSTTSLFGFKDKFVLEKDLNKRPSDLEIKQKGLPQNTPTIGERLRRDTSSPYWVPDRKGGYYKGTGTFRDHIPKDVTLHTVLTEGFQSVKEEVTKWAKETREEEWVYNVQPGDEKVEWSFESEEKRRNWVVTCDSTWGEGYSTATLQSSPSGRGALFSGELVTRPPPDGRIMFAGYANIKSIMRRKSFYRVQHLDWFLYSHLTMKIRGDGRSYLINLHPYNYYDIMWHDLWQFPLYTRGGPYWQKVKIPFSKFFLTNSGFIQDIQHKPPIEDVVSLGITLMDQIDGPFALEIDDIGVAYDPHYNFEEDHAYEMYMFPRLNYTNM